MAKYTRETPLHLAELLLANGAIIDARNGNGSTPLHSASERDSHGVLQVLLEYGADVNAKDGEGQTALHQVVGSSSTQKTTDTIRLLVKWGANVTAEINRDDSPIREAIVRKNDEELWALIEQNVEDILQVTRYDRYRTVGFDTRIGKLIAASMKLKAAGLSCTEDNFVAINTHARVLYEWAPTYRDRYTCENGDFIESLNELKFKCNAEMDRLRNHMLTDTMSLHAFILTDTTHCASSKNLLDTLRVIDTRCS